MTEYTNRIIEICRINFDFLIDYWEYNLLIFVVAVLLELMVVKIIEKK